MRYKIFIFIVVFLSLFVNSSCEKVTPSENPITTKKNIQNVASKINIIVNNYLSKLKISNNSKNVKNFTKLKNQNYDDNLIKEAQNISQHGKSAMNVLLQRIGTNPGETLILVEAYFQIVGAKRQNILETLDSKNKVLAHHAAFRFELRDDRGYIWGQKYLDILLSALDDKSTFACKESKIGRPVWMVAATNIKALIGLDFALTETALSAPDFEKRIKLLKNCLQLSIPYLYSRQFLHPASLHEFKFFHIDTEAMNANVPTKKYREKNPWQDPNATSGGYGSPFYGKKCFHGWDTWKQLFKTYETQRWELNQFELSH